MIRHTQTICLKQIADEFVWVCLIILCGWCQIEGRWKKKTGECGGGGVIILCFIFTFLMEASFSHKISYSYSTRIAMVFCLNVFLPKHQFEIIILIVFSLLSSIKVHPWKFENLPICLCSYKNTNLKISHS